MDLNTVWFVLFGVLIAGYAVLDGFDLGVGVLHMFARSDHERRVNINAIGPVWDGNEVWLLTGGGALFAAFPFVYATVFSGFYLALMLVLLALILRAVSMEFRGKVDSPGWRRVWDWSFVVGSLLPALLFGVAVGNILRGIPLAPATAAATGHPVADAFALRYTGTFFTLLNPYALLVGILSLVMLTMHGAAYMRLKSEGNQEARMKRWALGGWVAFVVLLLAATGATVKVSPFLLEGKLANPLFWLFAALLTAGVVVVPLATRSDRRGLAFLASSTVVASVVALGMVALFPRLVPSLTDLQRYSLDIYNSASTPRTLGVMLVIALVGMPLVVGYTAYVYRVFKGKVVLDDHSY